jgi:mono/diheme cytochrome c family protein
VPSILSTGLTVLVFGALGSPSAAQPLDDPDLASAWRTLRVIDCARCHGASYLGSSGPSIVEYARAQSREAFVRAVLDGEPARGMPGYRGNPLVQPAIDGIYRYFKGRADGVITADDRPDRR